jgi:hypothetical protein
VSRKVPEELARGAVDVLVEGITGDARRAGVVTPDVKAAEDFARGVVREVVTKEETKDDSFGQKPEPPKGLPPDRLSRGEVGPDTTVINRRVDLTKPRVVPGDPRLRARLDFLARDPDVEAKLVKAGLDGEVMAKRMGIHDYWDRMSIVADCVINEVEKYNHLYGDWRLPPKPKDRKIIVG